MATDNSTTAPSPNGTTPPTPPSETKTPNTSNPNNTTPTRSRATSTTRRRRFKLKLPTKLCHGIIYSILIFTITVLFFLWVAAMYRHHNSDKQCLCFAVMNPKEEFEFAGEKVWKVKDTLDRVMGWK